MSSTTPVKNDLRRRRFFPYTLVRFRGLRGGATSDVQLVARSRKVLEVQLGNDWVQFKRDDVFTLMNAIHAFLAFDERFREQLIRLELPAEQRRLLDELIAAYKQSEEGRADAHTRRDEEDEAAAVDGVDEAAEVEAPHPRRARRRSN